MPRRARPALPAGLAGTLLIFGGAAAYASQPTLGKIAYDHGADTVGLLTVRFPVAAALLAAFLLAWRGPAALRLPRGTASLTAAATVVYLGQSYGFFAALDRMDAAPTVLMLYLYPVFVTLAVAVGHRERVTLRQATLLAVTLLGVVLALGVEGRVTAAGVAFGFASAVLYAAFFLLSKTALDRGADAVLLTTIVYAGAGIAYLAASAGGDASLPVDASGWVAIAVMVGVGTIASALLVMVGLRRLPPAKASMLMLAEPVLAIALAAVALGERITPLQTLGAAIVVGALLLLARPEPAPTAAA